MYLTIGMVNHQQVDSELPSKKEHRFVADALGVSDYTKCGCGSPQFLVTVKVILWKDHGIAEMSRWVHP